MGRLTTRLNNIFIDRRWHSNILYVRSFRAADCNADHYSVVAKVRERLAVNKQEAQKFDAERFKLRQLRELEVRKRYQIEISNRFADLENLNDSEDINRALKNIKENIKMLAHGSLGLYELKQHKPWFDEECSRFLDQRKQAKMQWLQDPTQSNVDMQAELAIIRHAQLHRKGAYSLAYKERAKPQFFQKEFFTAICSRIPKGFKSKDFTRKHERSQENNMSNQ